MYLGIDTSNYTTSAASFDSKSVIHSKKLLSVKSGERGLRQSDAVFQHTLNMPGILKALDYSSLEAVGVSIKPRGVEGSYMPCFLVGEGFAEAIAKTAGVPLYKTSHQVNHILSALYSADRLDLIRERHIAFHLSGGTTEALLVTPDKDEIIKAKIIAESTDLKAGQAVDRAGVMLGLSFPCGRELDALSRKSSRKFNYRPSMKGADCSLSGVENKAKSMLLEGESKEDIARFVLNCVSKTVCAMLSELQKEYGALPVLFSGGVSSNTMLRKEVSSGFDNVYFAESEYSLDNAAGCAVFAYLKDNMI